jgi:uncharacterized protein YgiM (DUF1202 family)
MTAALTTGAAVMSLLAVLGAVAWAAEVFKVIERESAIRKDKKSYSPRLATVTEGQEVTVLETEEPWVQVEYKGQVGWMSQSALREASEFVGTQTAAARGTRATSETAADRGFTPEVEAKYRGQNPDLEAAFQLVEQITAGKVDDEKLFAFLKDGKLIDAGGGQ